MRTLRPMGELRCDPGICPDAHHQCVSCNKVGHWSRSWVWYGSYKDLDDSLPITKTCSQPCREQAIAEKKMPAETLSFLEEGPV